MNKVYREYKCRGCNAEVIKVISEREGEIFFCKGVHGAISESSVITTYVEEV